jgi:hypothetical protein
MCHVFLELMVFFVHVQLYFFLQCILHDSSIPAEGGEISVLSSFPTLRLDLLWQIYERNSRKFAIRRNNANLGITCIKLRTNIIYRRHLQSVVVGHLLWLQKVGERVSLSPMINAHAFASLGAPCSFPYNYYCGTHFSKFRAYTCIYTKTWTNLVFCLGRLIFIRRWPKAIFLLYWRNGLNKYKVSLYSLKLVDWDFSIVTDLSLIAAGKRLKNSANLSIEYSISKDLWPNFNHYRRLRITPYVDYI